MRTPDRVRQPAPAGWTDDEPARKLPAGRAKRVNPPLTAIISDESLYESTGFFLFIISQSGGRKLPFPTIKSLGIDGNANAEPADLQRIL